jgi:hypothetical protein
MNQEKTSMKTNAMKMKWLKSLVAISLIAGTAMAFAAKETITGLAKCAKPHLTVIEVKEGGKTINYHLAQNEVSKEFHSKICSKPTQIKASGDVEEVDGKWMMTATKLEVVEVKSDQ